MIQASKELAGNVKTISKIFDDIAKLEFISTLEGDNEKKFDKLVKIVKHFNGDTDIDIDIPVTLINKFKSLLSPGCIDRFKKGDENAKDEIYHFLALSLSVENIPNLRAMLSSSMDIVKGSIEFVSQKNNIMSVPMLKIIPGLTLVDGVLDVAMTAYHLSYNSESGSYKDRAANATATDYSPRSKTKEVLMVGALFGVLKIAMGSAMLASAPSGVMVGIMLTITLVKVAIQLTQYLSSLRKRAVPEGDRVRDHVVDIFKLALNDVYGFGLDLVCNSPARALQSGKQALQSGKNFLLALKSLVSRAAYSAASSAVSITASSAASSAASSEAFSAASSEVSSATSSSASSFPLRDFLNFRPRANINLTALEL